MRDPHQPEGDVLDRELQELSRRIPLPVSPGTAVAQDLVRGRRRLRRRRGVVGLGASTAALAVVGAAVLLPGMTGGDPVRGPAPAASDVPSDAASDLPADLPRLGTGREVEPRPGGADTTTADPMETFGPTLAAWNEVLAEHLDPRRTHLRPWGREHRNVQTAGGSTRALQALGSKYAWTEPGQDGLGMLQVEVAGSRGTATWPCTTVPEEAVCEMLEAAKGLRAAEVATVGGATSVLAERQDGETVVLTFDRLFGNDSLVPVQTEALAADALLAAASDPRLTLDGLPSLGVVEGRDGGLRELGEQLLAAGGELDATVVKPGEVRGVRRAAGSETGLRWTVHPVLPGAPDLEDLCTTVYSTCEVLGDGDGEVLVATTGAASARVDVVRRGPRAWAEVRVERLRGATPYPVEHAVAFVLDERWQRD